MSLTANDLREIRNTVRAEIQAAFEQLGRKVVREEVSGYFNTAGRQLIKEEIKALDNDVKEI